MIINTETTVILHSLCDNVCNQLLSGMCQQVL